MEGFISWPLSLVCMCMSCGSVLVCMDGSVYTCKLMCCYQGNIYKSGSNHLQHWVTMVTGIDYLTLTECIYAELASVCEMTVGADNRCSPFYCMCSCVNTDFNIPILCFHHPVQFYMMPCRMKWQFHVTILYMTKVESHEKCQCKIVRFILILWCTLAI